ncbi:MAG: HD domain-containing protein [Candidatus Pacebacteria bacterium]|jgi:tRNA nucleotidyltransferase (CCA-adding enzyme)|nr:HD domain-containing protein [Candidatus Paceibacterota bacterium]MBT6920937.1 HD domain-containing protein [Candidatus Paceibacterota bacterium]
MKNIKIPKSVQLVLLKLAKADFEAFIVGGSVRDILLKQTPKDWDIATKATPKQVIDVFPDGKYENAFGTVLLSNKYLSGLEIISEKTKIAPEVKKELLDIAKEKYLKKINCPGHGLLHAENVAKNALEIAKTFKRVDLDLIEVIAFLHDIGRAVEGKNGHIKKGQTVIGSLEGRLPSELLKTLKKAISHDSNVSRENLETQIIVEADLIEGPSASRINSFGEETKKEHNDWLKAYFNKEGAFKEIVSIKGRDLMFHAIEKLNKEEVGFKLPQIEIGENENIEITTFRIESKYSDKRHPDEVKFAKTLEEDLSRRDFTINAMALKQREVKGKDYQESLNIAEYEVTDPFKGRADLQNGLIRAVGDPLERFDEDALRMVRAVRFAVSLGFKLEKSIKEAIREKVSNMSFISMERIRDEFEKIILSDNPQKGVELLVETGLMKYIIPEVVETIGIEQNHHHYHGPYNTVYKHLMASLAKCPSKKLEVRLAAFLHDIGKPSVKRGNGEKATFYNHEYAGARMVRQILTRLKFPKKTIEKAELLVRNHMFYYNVDEVGEAGVRRVVRKVGKSNIKDLIDVRIGDRLGSGVPKAVPYKLRHFQYMVEKVSKDPISVKQLKINGDILIKELKVSPGPQIGAILEVLLAEVIERPEINEKEQLLILAKNLKSKDLGDLRAIAKSKIKHENKKEQQQVKQKHWVK